MDKITRDYRKREIGKCKNNNKYNPTIKLYGSIEGSTHCLSISLDEFKAIKHILIKGV